MAVSNKFGVVIGKRRLTTRSARPTPVTVSIGAPTLPTGQRDWQCPFRITGGGMRVVEHGYGVDSMQALQTALQGIRHFIDKSGKSFDWLGTETSGFQRSIPWYGDSRFTTRMERLVDAELNREGARMRRRHQARQKRKRAISKSS